MSIPANSNRPLEGQLLKDVLYQLMRITAIASSLKTDLEPLSEEDKALGAEPLAKEQIDDDLDTISRIASMIALQDLKATSDEWYDAMNKIE